MTIKRNRTKGKRGERIKERTKNKGIRNKEEHGGK